MAKKNIISKKWGPNWKTWYQQFGLNDEINNI
jgi:hypothetical protein